MRLAVISDLHLDINKIDRNSALHEMAQYLLNQQVAVYVLAGDTFNQLAETADFVRRLNHLVEPVTKVYYLAGNHEMGDGTSDEALENLADPNYFHNKSLSFGAYEIIGNNGWYDYSFDEGRHDDETIHRFKQRFWYDRRIDEALPDREKAERSAKQIEKAVLEAQKAGQKPLVISHFSTDQALVEQIPFSKPDLTILKAYLGSAALGRRLQELRVHFVLAGHVHWRMPAHRVNETTFYNVSLGYKTRRIHEWDQGDFFKEWKERLVMLDL